MEFASVEGTIDNVVCINNMDKEDTRERATGKDNVWFGTGNKHNLV